MDTKIREFELNIIRSLREGSSPFLDTIMEIITILGEKYILILGIMVIYFIYDKKIGQTIAYAIFSSLLVNNALKGIVKYARPFTTDETINAVRIDTATGFSFPSGHTQSASTFYTAIALNFKFTKKQKKIAWVSASTLIVLIGFSRVFLGVHYPKDVVIGITLGVGITFLCAYLYKKFDTSPKSVLVLLAVTLLIFTPFLVAFYESSYNDISIYRDFYLSYALFAGFICGLMIDSKYVNFTCNTTLKKRFIRLLGSALFLLIIEFGLKKLFNIFCPDGSIFLDFLRYFLLTFMILGVYPFMLKKSLFRD